MQALKAYYIPFYVLVFCTQLLYSQQLPYLERPVSIHVNNQPVSEVFKSITQQTSVVFSYGGFNDKQKITKQYTKWPLWKVLDDLFKDLSCTYILKEKYIIMHYNATMQRSEEEAVLKKNDSTSIISPLPMKRVEQLFLAEHPSYTFDSILKSVPTTSIIPSAGSPILAQTTHALKKACSLFEISIHATLAAPTGKGPDIKNMGVGFSINHFISKNIAVGLNGTHNAFYLNNVPDYNNFHCSVTQLSISGEYYLGDQDLRPYFETDLGLYINKVNYSYSYFVLPYFGAYYNKFVTVTHSDIESRFGFAPGVGMSYRLNGSIAINTALKYHVILSNYGIIPYWGIIAGLRFSL